ncbi:hypothetical protein JCM6882_000233 [Rhodosporidiobolus microsporus]
MLKRISFQKDKDPAFLVPPTRAAGAGSSSPLNRSPRSSPSNGTVPLPPVSPSSPSYPFPYVPPPSVPAGPPRSLERPVLHKSLAALSGLLIALDELRETTSARTKAVKRVSKAVKELAGGFTEKSAGAGGKSEVIVEALGGCASMLEALLDVDQKAAKTLEKDYEAINDSAAKYFKRTAKEEKTYEDTLASLDAKIAKTTASYQSLSASSTSSRNMHAALDSLTSQHTSYMNTLSNLSAQVQQTKASYAAAIAVKREAIAREVARATCGMAEKEWKSRVEATRKGGKEIGKVISGGAWCEAGMEEGGAVTFSGDVVGDEAPPEPLSRQPAPPTNDFSPSPRQVQFDSVQRNTSLRGPRAPSSSSALSASTASHPPHAPSYGSYESSQTGSATTTRQQSQPASAPPPPSAPPVEQPTSRQSLDRPAQERRVSFDEREPPSVGVRTPLAQPARDNDPYSPTSPPPGFLQRPTPRYGSLPPHQQPSTASAGGEADEFGRVSGGSGTNLQREDSFVARMSAKYASATVGAAVSTGRGESGRDQGGQADRPGHTRTDSRVQQLAKRYSSPPETAYPSLPPLSPTAPNAPTSPPSTGGRRPLAPTHRQSNSLQYPSSSSSGTIELSSSYALPAPNRPQFGSSSSYQTVQGQLPQQQPYGEARRPRAYERASPLPSQHESEFSSSTAAGSDQFAPPPSSSRPSFSSSPQPSYDRYTSPPHHVPPQPSHFSASLRSSPRPYDGDGETQVGAHTRICACPDCTAAKYGASSGAGGEGVERDEEQRLQRLLRREKEGTLKGLLAKLV